ncbi:hypothetical protein MMC16_006406 [Acarospora aff. strigata]|nr:hypothetical protein [Acarospora aff. strigata]
MSQPLSPLSPSDQNLKSPPTVKRENNSYKSTEIDSYVKNQPPVSELKENNHLGSPPIVAHAGVENVLPRKRQLSPSKDQSPNKPPPAKRHTSTALTEDVLKNEDDEHVKPVVMFEDDSKRQHSPRRGQSPNKGSPAKRHVSTLLTEEALKRNDDLTKSIVIFEDDSGIHYDGESPAKSGFEVGPGYESMDETCFSDFSAVPNADMTAFARLGQSPVKNHAGSPAKQQRQAQYREPATPRHGATTPGTVRRPSHEDVSPTASPTPRQPGPVRGANTTNLIIDFTEQFNAFSSSKEQASPSRNRRQSPSKYNTHSDLSSYASGRRTSSARHMPPPSTPSQSRPHLLDFDIPPAPTPRSVPTISAREIESMKSGYLSEISSMKATLSGKEAEVNSLKEAVSDAERRVGEALEQIREERGAKESLQADKADWEKRGADLESVLKGVKEQMLRGETDREDLARKLEESERLREEAEMRASEAESRVVVAGTRTSPSSTISSSEFGMITIQEKDDAVEKVARELHTVYKKKHEEKVSSLKTSYEKRWDKKIRSLEHQLADAVKENEELRAGKDATFSKIMPGMSTLPLSQDGSAEMQHETAATAKNLSEQKTRIIDLTTEIDTLKRENTVLRTALEDAHRSEDQSEETKAPANAAEHEAKVNALTEEVGAIKAENTNLRNDLRRERQANTDLVATVEEMMSLEASAQITAAPGHVHGNAQSQSQPQPQPRMQMQAPSSVAMSRSGSGSSSGSRGPSHSPRGSISRTSGLKAPGFSSSISNGSGNGVGERESKIGRMNSTGSRSRSGSGTGVAYGTGTGRSGIMGSIERMGRGGGTGRGGE